MEQQFLGQVIAVTGDSPYYEEAIERIVMLEGGNLGGTFNNDATWQESQIVIVGRDSFSEEYLLESINVGVRHGFKCCYLSQESFWDLWLWKTFDPYYQDDQRIIEHPGLSFLASIGFEWPKIRELQDTALSDDSHGWNEQSKLKSMFGYHVRKGLSEATRRNRLGKAVTAPDGLALQDVASHIVFLINLNRGKADPSLDGAIGRWKSDLDWLYQNFYLGSQHSFIWPRA
jgi:hypothetical protein